MNNDNKIPENGKRHKKIQKISKIAASSLLILIMVSVLCFSTAYEKIGFSVNGEEVTKSEPGLIQPTIPNADEL